MTTEHLPPEGGKAVAREETGTDSSSTRQPEAVPNKVTKTTEELPVQLNDVEWQNKARDMAASSKAVDEAVARKKSITSQATADVKVAEAKRDKLVDIVSTRTEMRNVTVETTYDYDAGTVTRKRTDNDEVLSVRDMIDAERQGQLMDANDFIEDARDKERAEDDAEAEDDLDDLDDEDLEDGPLDKDGMGNSEPKHREE